MERRLITFIVASSVFFFAYITLRSWLGVPPVKPDPVIAEVPADDLQAPVVGGADPLALESPAGELPAGDDVTASTPEIKRPQNTEWLTVGSMDATDDYFMLVTLCSKGAGIERLELTERDRSGALKYRRVDVTSGYLGYFAGTDLVDTDGVLVNVVGPGTPAAAAGIQVGDIIVGIEGEAVVSREALLTSLSKTRPGQKVDVEVTRSEKTETLAAELSEHPLDLMRLARDGGPDQIKGNLTRLSCLLTLAKVNQTRIGDSNVAMRGLTDPTQLNWDVVRESGAASFSVDLSQKEMAVVGGDALRITRSYQLPETSYALDLGVQVENVGTTKQDIGVRLEGANGISLEGWWYSTKISPNWGGAAARDLVYKTKSSGHVLVSGFELLKAAKAEDKSNADPALPRYGMTPLLFADDGADASRDLSYVGVDSQYFTVAFVPAEGQASLTTLERGGAGIASDPAAIIRHQERAVNSTYYVDTLSRSLEPGEFMRQDLRLFAGPKYTSLLTQYGLQDCIYYGWFSAIAKFLGSLLHGLSAVGNYALAIILLTLIVRGCMFPLSRKAAVNAQRMQELAPEMKKINEKYKDDMEGKVKAQRELQQRVGLNPLAGCLPMFIQLPIFLGLYRTLSVNIEMRQQPALSFTDWASNLAGPDKLAYWGDWLWDYLSGRGIGWLGPYFNVLPVIVVVLYLIQQKLFMPPATDEQTALTQKMMSVMTLMMGLFFFRVPAGLCIYFITSSAWGICERIIVKRTLPSKKHFDLAGLEGGATTAPVKSQSLAERIRSQMAKPEPTFEKPSKRKRPGGKKK
ncbi:MAG: preprotein translocase YidC [Rhodopirellula sp. TMED283]|nr:MAG: preprotein translocase YidC [Rhodopirellula sp. TMED283]